MKGEQIKNNLGELLQLKNQTEDAVDVFFYGDIVSAWYGKWSEEDKYPMEVKQMIDSAGGRDINVHINSGGGSVFAGMAIYNMLANYSGTVTAYVDGMAASIASVIALAADRVVMRTGSAMMIHKPMAVAIGAFNSDELAKMAADLDEIQKCIMEVYDSHKADGVDLSSIEKKVNAETWMTADEAAEVFNVETEGEMQAVAMIGSDFIAKYSINGIPPQYAQRKPETEEAAIEDIANKEAVARAKAEVEILEMGEITK